MDKIILLKEIDNYEKSIDYLQILFALSLYEWYERKDGIFLLIPTKRQFFRAIFSLYTILLCAVGFIILFSWKDSFGILWGTCLGICFMIGVLACRFRQLHKIRRNLPIMPIAVMDMNKRKLYFRRNMACTQIHSSRLSVNFDDLVGALWKSSYSIKNGRMKLQTSPIGRTRPHFHGFYIYYLNEQKEILELIFCGQEFSSKIYEFIFEKTKISFYSRSARLHAAKNVSSGI